MSALVKVVQEHLMTIYIARSIAEHSFQMQRCVKFIKVYRLHTPVTRRKQNVQHRNGQEIVGRWLLTTVCMCLKHLSPSPPYMLCIYSWTEYLDKIIFTF